MRLISQRNFDSPRAATWPQSRRGAILLEVVLALILFVAAAAIVTGGLNASMSSVERLRLNAHAANLAVSVLSELQMGARSMAMTGPEPFEKPFEEWTWELVAAPVQEEAAEASRFRKVEVVIRHEDPAVVYRLCQVLRLEEPKPADELGALSGAGNP